MSELRRSPLHPIQLAGHARMVKFAGWEMPVQFGGILQEHQAVRSRWGIFDISHMGIFRVHGRRAGAELDAILSNHLGKLSSGRGQYTLLLNERGGVIDDLIVYRLEEDTFILVVNAARVEEDREWVGRRLTESRLEDLSGEFGGVAVQGPSSVTESASILPVPVPQRNGIALLPDSGGLICRTGYTGEDGFELFAPADRIGAWWSAFCAAGAEPCGLGARDTLRLEVCYPLNGADLLPDRTPLEAGLDRFVHFEKGDFPGRESLIRQREEGVRERLAAFVMTGSGPPPRAHYVLHAGIERVGEATSGCHSPSLERGIGMAYVKSNFARPDTNLEIDIRGRRYPVQIRKKPLYRKQ